MLVLVVFVIVTLTILLIKAEFRRLQWSKNFRHIPGIKEYPIVGSAFTVRRNLITNFELFFDEVCVAPVSKLTFGGHLLLVMTDPQALQEVLSSSVFLKRPYYFEFFEVESALFTSVFGNWKPLRKQVNSAFSHRATLQLIPKFHKHIDRFTEKIEFYSGKEEFDIRDVSNIFAIEQIFDTMFGMDYDCHKDLPEIVGDSADAISNRILNPVYHPNMTYRYSWMLPTYRRVHKFFHGLKDQTDPIIQNRLNVLRSENKTDQHLFLDEILRVQRDGKSLSYMEIQENMLVIMVSGAETSAYTIAHTILMLAMHPEIDQKVYKEISELYDPETTELTPELVKQMTCLDMVLKEVLRLFPPVPLNGREALSDVHLPSINATIPKGTIVVIPYYRLHKSKELWGPDAEKFNPDNFLPENIAKRHPYSYIPFSNGARNCIGIHYANLNLRMALVKTLVKYRFTTRLKYEDLKPKWGIVFKLNNEYMVKAHPRR